MSVTTQIAALRSAHEHFQEPEMRILKRKLAETTLEMERSRMTAEDESTDRQKILRTLHAEVISPAQVTLLEASFDIRLSKKKYHEILKAAYNSLRDVERTLDEFAIRNGNTRPFQAYSHFFKSAPLSHRKDSATSQNTAITALGFVYQHFQESEKRSGKRKLEETTLEMERASMTAEDERAKRNETVERVYMEVISPAKTTLKEARHDIEMALQDSKTNYKAALITAWRAMWYAHSQLEDDPFQVDDEDPDEFVENFFYERSEEQMSFAYDLFRPRFIESDTLSRLAQF